MARNNHDCAVVCQDTAGTLFTLIALRIEAACGDGTSSGFILKVIRYKLRLYECA